MGVKIQSNLDQMIEQFYLAPLVKVGAQLAEELDAYIRECLE